MSTMPESGWTNDYANKRRIPNEIGCPLQWEGSSKTSKWDRVLAQMKQRSMNDLKKMNEE